jgi:hypothetical protein
MIWMIFFGIMGLIGTYRFMKSNCDGFVSWFFGMLGIIVGVMVMVMVGVIPALITGNFLEKTWEQTEQIELLSLRNNDGVSGHFFLGSGSIQSEQYYFFHKKSGDGYQPGRVKADDNVLVHESEGQGGMAKVYTRKFVNKRHEWYAACWPSEKYEFFIPNGSLQRDFVLK